MERQHWRAVLSAKRRAPTFGGCNRCSFFSAYRRLSSILRVRRFRVRTISLVITSRLFIRRKFLSIRHTAGLDPGPRGGQAGSFFLPRYSFSGLLPDFA